MSTAPAGSLRKVAPRTAGVIASLAFLAPVWGESDAPATKFLTDAIRSNIAEVRMSDLAQQRGKSKDVREFSAALVADHTMALQKVSALAKTLGVTPPTESTADAIKKHEAMSKLSGEDFDRAFTSHMVMGHEQSISRYTEASRDASNAEVAKLAQDTLPTLERHLATARTIDKNLNAD